MTSDFNGNLTSLDGDTYTWNARNQLTGIAGAGLSASFAYDALGRRLTKTVNGQGRTFAYDGVNPIEEQSGASVVASMLTGLGVDEVFRRTEGGVSSFVLPDALGSAVALASSAGAIQTEYTYEPFGRTTVAGAASTNPFQFTGRENDGATGLYYYRARYYHPVLQRFISEDPIRFRGGDVNLYGYVLNSPVNGVDPTGLFVLGFGCEISGGFGLLGGEFSVDFVIDSRGNYGFVDTKALLAGPQVNAGVGCGPFVSSASTISDLVGESQGAGANLPFGPGGDITFGIDPKTRAKTSVSFDIRFGPNLPPGGGGVFVEGTGTTVHPRGNIIDDIRNFLFPLRERRSG
ncbi:MAG: RHS repeat-associated core domain-containing protein [Candidatus Binatia bacterium]